MRPGNEASYQTSQMVFHVSGRQYRSLMHAHTHTPPHSHTCTHPHLHTHTPAHTHTCTQPTPAHSHTCTGNHESITMNQMYGFEGEVKQKYPHVHTSPPHQNDTKTHVFTSLVLHAVWPGNEAECSPDSKVADSYRRSYMYISQP